MTDTEKNYGPTETQIVGGSYTNHGWATELGASTCTDTRHTSWPRTPASDLSDRLQDPEFSTRYGNIKREADQMVNRLFSGRFTSFWRLWYGVRGL